MIKANTPLAIFKLLMLTFWLFLLSSAPFLLSIVTFLYEGGLWLNAFFLSPQLIWAFTMFLGALSNWRSDIFNGCAIVFSLVAGYLAYNVARHIHVSSLIDQRDWGMAWDIWGLTFVYCPILLVLFSLILWMRKWLGLVPLFGTKAAPD